MGRKCPVGTSGHSRGIPQEVRGPEVVDMLAAMNTGHEGGCGTLHANSAADVPARIEALATAAGLSREAAIGQLWSAIDLVVHLSRDHARRRRVAEIGVLVRERDGLAVVPAVRFDAALGSSIGPGFGRLEELMRR